MKRFITVILLGVHLFTVGAYAFMFNYFAQQPDVQMVKQLYDSKTDKNLIEIKIPIRLPGVSAWTAYEKIRGQLQLKNASYVYVSLKMSKDTMSLLCIPNTPKTRLVNANIITAKEISDVPMGKKAHNNTLKKSLDTQYNYQTLQHRFLDLSGVKDKNFGNACSSLLHPFIKTQGQPPDHSC